VTLRLPENSQEANREDEVTGSTPAAVRTMVAGVGPTYWEDPVLPSAIRLAQACGAELHVVRAFDAAGAESGSAGDGGATGEALARRQAEILTGLEGMVESLGGAPMTRCHAAVGSPAEAVAELAHREGADVVVVGAARKENLQLRLLGTKAERIISMSRLPVLVLRTMIDVPVRRVLLACDGSEGAGSVLTQGMRTVMALFGDGQKDFRCLRVKWQADGTATGADQEVGAEATRSLADFLTRQGARGVEARVRLGMPAGEILAEAREWPADLVVLGSHARSGVERAMVGSVSASVLRDLPGNAVVVPAAATAPPHASGSTSG
jgi:nucleotide-binding universal stress UspA family protein